MVIQICARVPVATTQWLLKVKKTDSNWTLNLLKVKLLCDAFRKNILSSALGILYDIYKLPTTYPEFWAYDLLLIKIETSDDPTSKQILHDHQLHLAGLTFILFNIMVIIS